LHLFSDRGCARSTSRSNINNLAAFKFTTRRDWSCRHSRAPTLLQLLQSCGLSFTTTQGSSFLATLG